MRRLGLRSGVVICCASAVALAAFGLGIAQGSATVSSRPGSTACNSRVPTRLLPTWARTGFSNPRPRMPFVLASNGEIGAIVWGATLFSPPPRTHNNKILWVSRRLGVPGSDLRISARRLVGSIPEGPAVRRTVPGGPGPSIINLPAAGCWRLSLRWSGRSDTLDLRYVRNS
jgi:hypothetical protein